MSLTNGDHDDSENDVEGEVSITFNLRAEDIEKLGLSMEDCESALMDALEAQDELEADDAPAFEEIQLKVGGKSVRLGDIADIEMTTTFDDLEDDESFDDEDEDDDFDLEDEEEA